MILDMPVTPLPLVLLACDPTITTVSPHTSPAWVQLRNDCEETLDTAAYSLRFGAQKWSEAVELPDGFLHPGQCFDAAAQMMPRLGHCFVGVALFDVLANVLVDPPIESVGIGLKWASSCGIDVEALGIAPFGFVSSRKGEDWYMQPATGPATCLRPPAECIELLGFAPGFQPWVQLRNICDFDLDMAQFAIGYGWDSLSAGAFLSHEILAPGDCLTLENYEGEPPLSPNECALGVFATTVQGGISEYILAGEEQCSGGLSAPIDVKPVYVGEAVYRGWPSWSWMISGDEGPMSCDNPWLPDFGWKG